MAVVQAYVGWPWAARGLALIALFLVILVAVVPGSPEWLLQVSVALVAIGLMLR